MRNVLVTGANRGIGQELVKYFVARGDTVIATVRDVSKAKDLQDLGKKFEERIRVLTLDVSSVDVGHALTAQLKGVIEHLDILVNNAGVMLDANSKLANFDFKSLDDTLAVNLYGVMRVTQALLPYLQKSRAPKIASITSKMGSIADNSGGGYYAYRISKTSLNMFNRSLSVEFPRIICTVFHPGWVMTDMGGSNAPLSPEKSAQGLGAQIDKLSLDQSGEFLDYAGKTVPW